MLKNNNNNNTVQTVSYSSHPSFFVCFSGVGSHWQQAQKVILEALLPSNTSQLLLGNPETFPGQMRYIIPPVSSGSAQGSPPSWSCQENIQREAPRRQLHFELPPDVRAPHPISEDEPLLSEDSYSLGLCPKLVIMGECWNVDRATNKKLHLPADVQQNRRCFTIFTIPSVSRSLVNKTPKYLSLIIYSLMEMDRQFNFLFLGGCAPIGRQNCTGNQCKRRRRCN